MLRLFGDSALGFGGPTKSLLENKSLLFGVEGLGKETKLLLSVWIDVLAILLKMPFENDLFTAIALCYRSDVYTQAHAGDAVVNLVKLDKAASLPEAMRGFLFSYSCYLAKSLHFQLNLRGLKLLAAFLSDGAFRQAAAQALYDGYMGQSPRGKQIIIDAIPAIRMCDEEMAEELRAMVLRDNTTTAVAHLQKREAGA